MKVIDFYGKRHLFFGFSILIMLCGLIGYIVNGVVLDIILTLVNFLFWEFLFLNTLYSLCL